MELSREAIVEGLQEILGHEHVVTDPHVLEQRSIDNFRKLREHLRRVHAARARRGGDGQEHAGGLGGARLRRPARRQRGPAHRWDCDRGGLETVVENSIVLDGSGMDQILSVDAYDMQATCQCGVPLQVLEDRARELGLTTGHSPQSKPVAHMGGLVATRSIGQLSTLYGGIEDMVVGLEAVFPGGAVARIKNVPRRAAGPDIRHVVIGNEGALCFITEVTVKLFPYLPENNVFLGWTLKSMASGFEVLREVMVAGYKPSVARLYDPEDGGIHFSHFAEPDDCVLLFMAEGARRVATCDRRGDRRDRLPPPGVPPGRRRDHRRLVRRPHVGPDKINAEDERIRTTRNVNRTTEVSADWSSINDIYEAAIARIRAEVPDLTILGGHSSHSYINGTNMYFNYFYDLVDCEPEEEVTKYYLPIIAIICEETLRYGGSIVHHHGIGKARARWVREEYGSSYPMLEALKHAFDPNGVMNAGTIIPR